jgi:hypothetical protein
LRRHEDATSLFYFNDLIYKTNCIKVPVIIKIQQTSHTKNPLIPHIPLDFNALTLSVGYGKNKKYSIIPIEPKTIKP